MLLCLWVLLKNEPNLSAQVSCSHCVNVMILNVSNPKIYVLLKSHGLLIWFSFNDFNLFSRLVSALEGSKCNLVHWITWVTIWNDVKVLLQNVDQSSDKASNCVLVATMISIILLLKTEVHSCAEYSLMDHSLGSMKSLSFNYAVRFICNVLVLVVNQSLCLLLCWVRQF